MENSSLTIIQKLDRKFIFQGLSINCINLIREHGLWMPVTKDLIKLDRRLKTQQCQLYIEGDNNSLLVFIIEYGEFLAGTVYTVMDHDKNPSIHTYLHQYAMEDGSLIYEDVQYVEKGIVFLRLINDEREVICDWSDKSIDAVLNSL